MCRRWLDKMFRHFTSNPEIRWNILFHQCKKGEHAFTHQSTASWAKALRSPSITTLNINEELSVPIDEEMSTLNGVPIQ